MTTEDIKAKLLQKYTRPIIHMRNQYKQVRLGLVFGAGISKDLRVPNWAELVKKIAYDSEVKGRSILNKAPKNLSLPFQTQMLFEHFRNKKYEQINGNKASDRKVDYQINSEWRSIIRKHLYKNAPNNIKKAAEKHPYLGEYIKIIKKSHLTVNYNFDDFIERFLAFYRTEDESLLSRGYESVTNASLQFRSSASIIYHPNGMFPFSEQETPSDRLIFDENAFADQLVNLFAGDYTTLLNHFSKNTCLFIGLSLDDQTLRNLLRQTSKHNPGHYHYYVHYNENSTMDHDDSQKALRKVNFKVYNLITLFLNADEICALAELVQMTEDDFNYFSSQHGIKNKNYCFYLTGPLGVGKTTAIAYFRNLTTFDEWLDARPPVLQKDSFALNPNEKAEADSWILPQFELKNKNIMKIKSGIMVVDRGPMDPLAFTPESEWDAKAKELLKAMCPDQADWKVESGSVILLVDDEDELELRMRLTGRSEYTASKLLKMGETLEQIYKSPGLHIIRCHKLSKEKVVKKIANIIHMKEYKKINLHRKLNVIKGDL